MSTKNVITLDPNKINNLDIITQIFYSFISNFLDNTLSANTWNLRYVALVTVLILFVIRKTLKSWHGIEWYSFVHAIVSGYGAFIACYISLSAQELTGTEEPLRSILCQGPLTSLHRLIPAITMGFGIFDMIDGLSHGIDFILHGIATFTIMVYFCEYDVPEIMVPMLLMEISTVHLTVVKADFVSELVTSINMGCFVLTFAFYRCAYVPYIMYYIITDSFTQRYTSEFQSCLPWHFPYVVLVVGTFFNCLNSYWMYKIIRKVLRKMKGIEKVKENNQLGDKEAEYAKAKESNGHNSNKKD